MSMSDPGYTTVLRAEGDTACKSWRVALIWEDSFGWSGVYAATSARFTREDAVTEAKAWATFEGVKYREPDQKEAA